MEPNCIQYDECELDCQLRDRYLSQKWFSNWVNGEPEKKKECNNYTAKKDLIEGLFD